MRMWGFLVAIFLSTVSPSFAQQPSWTQKFPAQSPPAGGAPMAYDSARQQVALFTDSCHTSVPDTWIWDGNAWTEKFPATSPPARCGANLVYDSARNEVVLF